MKNIPKFLTEIIVTVIVAGILSMVPAAILLFIFGNLQMGDNGVVYANTISSIVFGLVVGYKLNSLIREHKQPKGK